MVRQKLPVVTGRSMSQLLSVGLKKTFAQGNATKQHLSPAYVAAFVSVFMASSSTSDSPDILVRLGRVFCKVNARAKHATDTKRNQYSLYLLEELTKRAARRILSEL